MMYCALSALPHPRSMVFRPKRLISWWMVSWLPSMNSPHHSLTIPSAQVVVSECMRPPMRSDASKILHERPASCKVRAALSPAIPAPTIAIRGIVLLLFFCQRPAQGRSASQAILTLVLPLRELDGKVGNGIPRVVDAGEQEQQRNRSDDEQCWRRIAQEHNRRDDECGVGNERKDRMPQPVFQYRLIVSLTARPPYHNNDVRHPPETREAEQQASIPERWPWRAQNRGDEERDAKMHDVWRAECRQRPTRPSRPSPHDQGNHHKHQSSQCRSSGADDDVKVLPGGKRRQRSLLHDGSSLRYTCKR